MEHDVLADDELAEGALCAVEVAGAGGAVVEEEEEEEEPSAGVRGWEGVAHSQPILATVARNSR